MLDIAKREEKEEVCVCLYITIIFINCVNFFDITRIPPKILTVMLMRHLIKEI